MSAIKVNLDGLDSSALQIKTLASTLDDLKSSMNGVFSSIDPKIKRRRNISGSIADIQKKMQMLYTEMNELSRFISSSKNQYANAEARLAQMSNDYTNRISNFRTESADVGVCAAAGVSPTDEIKEKSASESWMERVGDAVTGKAKSWLENFFVQAGASITDVGYKIKSGVAGIADATLKNFVQGNSFIPLTLLESFLYGPNMKGRFVNSLSQGIDALQADSAEKKGFDKKWYYGGRALGDLMNMFVGAAIAAKGVMTIAGGIFLTAGGVAVSSTGVGTIVGVPAIAVSSVAVAEGAIEIAAGVSMSIAAFHNINDDFSKFQQEGQANGDSDSGEVIRGKSRAPETGEPGSTYEQVDDKGNVMSKTKYGENRKPEYRDDLTGKPHYDKKTGQYLDQHRHSYEYNDKGQPIGEVVSPISD